MRSLLCFFLALGALISPALAQKKADVVAVNDDRPGLPRVLLVGDSVALGYSTALGIELKGKAVLFRTRKLGGSTTHALPKMESFVGNDHWDVIFFNWGIQDMTDLDHTGSLQATPPQYDKNLRALVARLKATGAKLVFGTTTPIPEGWGDVPGYNVIAQKIMKENNIPVADLYTAMLPHVAEDQIPKDVHFNLTGYALLAKEAAASIVPLLGKK
jgi:acyl-CoA thioesterase-1